MIGHPTWFKDGATPLINFSNYSIPHPFVLSNYQSRVDPIIELPGGAIFDVWEASDLPEPRLMPFAVDLIINGSVWAETVGTWQRTFQGRHGTLTAREINTAVTRNCDAYLTTVNLVGQWGSGGKVRLAFIPLEDWR